MRKKDILMPVILAVCALTAGCSGHIPDPQKDQEETSFISQIPEGAAVSYLGPQGTYTEEAAQFYFQNAAEFFPKQTAEEAIADVVNGDEDYMNNSDGYFLVETKGRQILVRVGKDFITSSELANRVDPKKFVIGNNVFRKTTYQLI